METVILFLAVVFVSAIILYSYYHKGNSMSRLNKFEYVDTHSDYFFKPPNNIYVRNQQNTIPSYLRFVKNN